MTEKEPVSYTHLDVYKRQASRISKSSQRISERMSRFMGESSTMSTIGRCSFSERTASGAMSAVTTDVYKRQAL